MSFMGQIMGGSIGFMLGGPIGAMLGVVVGGSMSRNAASKRLGANGNMQLTFFVATFSMLGKMAAADGEVSEDERQVVDNLMTAQMSLDRATSIFAMKVFDKATVTSTRFEEFATQFRESFSSRPEIIRSMLDMLLRVSMADRILHAEEEKLLQSAVRIFGISNEEYRHMKDQYCPDTDKDYATLGCDRSASMEEIKQKYRQLVRDYHPDRIVSKGLPEEFTKFATQKFQEIQAAYENITKERAVA